MLTKAVFHKLKRSLHNYNPSSNYFNKHIMIDLVILSGLAVMGAFSFVATNDEFHHDMESKIKRGELAAPKESSIPGRRSFPEEKIVQPQSSSPNSKESFVSVYGNDGKYRAAGSIARNQRQLKRNFSSISGYTAPRGGAASNAAHLTKNESGTEAAFSVSCPADYVSSPERTGYPPLFISNAQYRSGRKCTMMIKNMPHHRYSTPPSSPSSSSGASTPSLASIPDALEWSDPFMLDAAIWSVECY
jgi:hypothetical protein